MVKENEYFGCVIKKHFNKELAMTKNRKKIIIILKAL